MVDGAVFGGFPDFDFGEAEAVGQLELVGDMNSDVFGGRVGGGEGVEFVKVTVVQGGDDLVEQAVELVEIHDDANAVEFLGADGDADLPVVAMKRLERSVVKTELMGGGKVAG